MAAKSDAIIGQLEAKVATLEGRIQSRLGELRDGEPGPVGPQGPVGSEGPRGAAGPQGTQGPQGTDGAQGIQGEAGPAGPPGQDGAQGPAGAVGEGAQGPQGAQGPAGNDGLAGPQGPAGERGLSGAQGVEGPEGPHGTMGPAGLQGPQGERGEKGNPGLLPFVRAWSENEITYAGGVVFCDGGSWQAQKDTAQKPPHKDWKPVAVAGRSATTPVIRGTFDPAQSYDALNIVALNNSSFMAKCDNPGECPGDGWQLIASAGRAGKPGPKGERGERGAPGVSIARGEIDRKTFMIKLTMTDGTLILIPCRAMFEQYHEESDG